MSLRESYQQHKKTFLIGAVCAAIVVPGLYYFKGRSKAPKFITIAVRHGDINAAVQATQSASAKGR